MPSNFEIAALDAEKTDVVTDENLAEITVNGRYLTLWRRPTPGQYGMFQLRISRNDGTERARGVDRFFSMLMLTPEEIQALADAGASDNAGEPLKDREEDFVGLDFFVDLIAENKIDEDFLITMLKEAMEQHSGFPTSPAPASSRSPKSNGRPSTAASRRVRSTPSA